MKKVLSLFSGAGGLDLGFEEANYRIMCAIEFDTAACDTYRNNFKDSLLLNENINNICADELSKQIGEIDVIIGGPPCQGFSIAGKSGRLFLEDERNRLFLEYARFVESFMPKAFLLENVARMKTHNGGETLKEIIDTFEKIGYELEYNILNSEDYGIAQQRRRFFLIGIRKDIRLKFEFPDKLKKQKKLIDVIGDLPRVESGNKNENILQHIPMSHTDQMLNKMKYVKEGSGRECIPESIRPTSGDARKYIRLDRNKPCYCVTGDMRKVFHYEQNRALTIRELARIQSFPDNFKFSGTSSQIQQQIGNAVPPKLSYILACRISEVIDG
jgi:DNA (cytosine-5)-methyltransferase 1